MTAKSERDSTERPWYCDGIPELCPVSSYDRRKNIGYGLKNMKMPADQIKKKVDWAIDILGLQEFRYRKPKNLSGGQRQRVALGRAIVKNQKVFLMDEHCPIWMQNFVSA